MRERAFKTAAGYSEVHTAQALVGFYGRLLG
jgi:hypothetical protein